MKENLRPVVWLGEPKDFSEQAKRLLETQADLVCKKISVDELKDVFKICDAFIFRLGFKIQEKDLHTKQRCKLIATPVTGLDHIDLEACRKYNIQIISLKGETEFLKDIRATAEHTFAILFALIRKIIPASTAIKNEVFNRDAYRGVELYQKTMGIIGYGRLGKIVSSFSKAFGMKVLVHEINPEIISEDPALEFVSLNELLSHSDYISLHVDARIENQEMVNAGFLSNMKKTAILINTSRGSLIDESALVIALENKSIAGAAIDVVNGEPRVNFSNKLFEYHRKHDNLLITPHLGGNTIESMEKTECFIANKVIKQLSHDEYTGFNTGTGKL